MSPPLHRHLTSPTLNPTLLRKPKTKHPQPPRPTPTHPPQTHTHRRCHNSPRLDGLSRSLAPRLVFCAARLRLLRREER